jgi:hypothetical protein
MHFWPSRPSHEEMERFFGHIINSSRKKGSRMMMMDLIAGSFDILVRRVHKKRSHRRR